MDFEDDRSEGREGERRGEQGGDSPFVRVPWHTEAQKLIQMVSDPDTLEGETVSSLRACFAQAGYREISPSAVSLRWKYSAMFRSGDGELLRVDVDVNGTYAIGMVVEDMLCPKEKELEDLRTAAQRFGWYLEMCNQSEQVGIFLREVVGGAQVPVEEGKVDWSGFRESCHPRVLELLHMLMDPEHLEGDSLEELRRRLEEGYGYSRVKEELHGRVIIGWGEALGAGDLRTGAAVVTNDQRAILLGLGHDGEYFIEALAKDAWRPSRLEEKRVRQLLEEYAFQWYEQTEAFRNFKRLVQGRMEVRKEYPVGEWVLEMRDRIMPLLDKFWRRKRR